MKKLLLSAVVFAASTIGAYAAGTKTAVFAGGCFWCVESDFESLKGVKEVVSGYTGGKNANPTYKTIGSHIEAVKIFYDPSVISYETLVDKFFRSVDPTDAGGQFCDRGNSYTTAIFANGASERAIAEKAIAAINASGKLPKKVVTPVRNASKFYDAEDYHQDYYKQTSKVLTRFGRITKASAYKKYRKGCGRDERVKQLWGSDAAFVGG
ncbi:peptide-methionine (S)-S-oxide reductase MsrA [Paramylibacter kogurei]|nr:peptide-methionine (S)-S-oxide reductase MsrA [Amylibacter kogurei]